jgi:hypothetical protein
VGFALPAPGSCISYTCICCGLFIASSPAPKYALLELLQPSRVGEIAETQAFSFYHCTDIFLPLWPVSQTRVAESFSSRHLLLRSLLISTFYSSIGVVKSPKQQCVRTFTLPTTAAILTHPPLASQPNQGRRGLFITASTAAKPANLDLLQTLLIPSAAAGSPCSFFPF